MGVLAPATNGQIRSAGGIILPRVFETFDGANSDTLGPDQSWTELAGDIDVVSDAAEVQSGGGAQALARLDLDLGSTNHFIEAQCLQFGDPSAAAHSTFGLILRKDTSATLTFYMVEVSNVAVNVVGYKCVSGTYTSLSATNHASVHATEPFTFRVEIEGTAIRAYQDGTLVRSWTDSSITSGNYVGLRSYREGTTQPKARYNNIVAGPL